MVATRSARKRASGELSTRTSILSLSSSGGVKTRNHNQQHSSSTSSSCNTRNNSDELSLQPKIKRQRTTASQKSKKARALKPVPANVKKQQPGAGSSKTARSSRAKKIVAPVDTTTTKPTKFEASTTAASASAATTKSKSSTNKKRETKKASSKRKSSSSSSNSKNEQQRKKQQLRNKNNASSSSSSSSTTTDVETTATIAGADEPQQRTKFLRSASTRSSRSSSSSTSAAASLSLLSRSSSTKKGSTRNIIGAEDIDAKDRNDPTYVTDYVDDMYEHYRYKEETTTVDRMYMGSTTDKGKTGGGGGGKKKQPHINETMRCILVDWLVEVHYKFKLFPETLYLTVNLLDRFLSKSKESITKRDLQLVGVTALLISSKYEEMYIPELRDLTYICDGAYTEAKILRMEEKILKTLAYNVTVPTPYTFLVRFLKAANADKLMSQIANFVLDGTLLTLEHLTCVWRPSQLAAAAVFIARRALAGGGRRTTPHSHHWSSTLIKYTLYDVKEVVPVARSILNAKKKLDRNKELLALQKKYSKTKYGKVSHYKFDPIES